MFLNGLYYARCCTFHSGLEDAKRIEPNWTARFNVQQFRMAAIDGDDVTSGTSRTCQSLYKKAILLINKKSQRQRTASSTVEPMYLCCFAVRVLALGVAACWTAAGHLHKRPPATGLLWLTRCAVTTRFEVAVLLHDPLAIVLRRRLDVVLSIASAIQRQLMRYDVWYNKDNAWVRA